MDVGSTCRSSYSKNYTTKHTDLAEPVATRGPNIPTRRIGNSDALAGGHWVGKLYQRIPSFSVAGVTTGLLHETPIQKNWKKMECGLTKEIMDNSLHMLDRHEAKHKPGQQEDRTDMSIINRKCRTLFNRLSQTCTEQDAYLFCLPLEEIIGKTLI
jgi:hypothetical protein